MVILFFEVVFIFEVVSIFQVIFIFQVVFIFEVVFIFQVIFIFRLSLFFRCSSFWAHDIFGVFTISESGDMVLIRPQIDNLFLHSCFLAVQINPKQFSIFLTNCPEIPLSSSRYQYLFVLLVLTTIIFYNNFLRERSSII